MRAPASASLNAVPQEVLEHIAFFAATDTFLGPPSGILPLLTTNQRIYSLISIESNQHLYARIFAAKFDTAAAIRRLGRQSVSPAGLADELQRRCVYLKRIRARSDATAPAAPGRNADMLRGVLWTAYLMILENDGKNEAQLRQFGRIDEWLREYWFSECGASFAVHACKDDCWPQPTENASLAMWLFWFLFRPDDYMGHDIFRTATGILKILALGAHQYSLTPSWSQFIPEHLPIATKTVKCYAHDLKLAPPPLAVPAILSFLTVVNNVAGPAVTYPIPVAPSTILPGTLDSHELECDWGKCISLGCASSGRLLTGSYRPGSIEGVWEGMFTYTEFTAYASVLAGSPPQTLQRSVVVRHRQTWILREHLLMASDVSDEAAVTTTKPPLGPGDPLRSYFPTGTRLHEDLSGVDVRDPGDGASVFYQRASRESLAPGAKESLPPVQDVIITGEGHSAWGQFNIVGRVRPIDGFISLSKEYVDGDRGKWIYRGYLVGDVSGNLAGRWRDTLSPAGVPGYEGCFTMSRRRG